MTSPQFHQFLNQLLYARCREVALRVPNKDAAVSLRQRLNVMRTKIQEDGTSSRLVDRATLRVIYTTADKKRHSYRDNTSVPKDAQITAWEVNVQLPIDAEIKRAVDLISA